MEETDNKLFTKKNIISLLIIGIILLIIPVGVKLAQQQQQFRSQAANPVQIIFTGPNVSTDKKTATTPEIEVQLHAPWPPISQTP